MGLKLIDVSKPLEAYDEVLGKAKNEGREPNTADRMLAMRAAILAYEAEKALVLPPFAAPAGRHCVSALASHPILYTDTVYGVQTCRDDLWAVSTDDLNSTCSQIDGLLSALGLIEDVSTETKNVGILQDIMRIARDARAEYAAACRGLAQGGITNPRTGNHTDKS